MVASSFLHVWRPLFLKIKKNRLMCKTFYKASVACFVRVISFVFLLLYYTFLPNVSPKKPAIWLLQAF